MNWIYLNLKIFAIKNLISKQKYVEADAMIYLMLKKFPCNSRLLRLKVESEKGFSYYLYQKEYG